MGSKSTKTPSAPSTESAFRVEILNGGKQVVAARVHHESRPDHTASAAAKIFLQAEAALKPLGHTPILMAGAGFGKGDLETALAKRLPNATDFRLCLAAANSWLAHFSKEVASLKLHALFGLDVYAACERNPSFEAVAQFVVHFDPKGKKATIVASKRLPASEETGFLFCEDQIDLPKIINLDGLGKLLPLVCHDMNVWNPRGIAAQDPKGKRANRRGAITESLETKGLEVAFAAIHSLWPSAPTFKTSMAKLEKMHKGVKAIAAFGTYKDSLSRVLMIAERHTPTGWCTAELIPQSWPQ